MGSLAAGARSNSEGVYIFGAGGHGKVVFALLQANGLEISGFIDDYKSSAEKLYLGQPVFTSGVITSGQGLIKCVIAIGDNHTRQKLDSMWRSQVEWVQPAHPFSWIHESVQIGDGTVMCAGSIIQPDVIIGRHVIVNSGAVIDHDCRIADYVHIAPGVKIAGKVTIGAGSLIGVGTALIPGITVGKGCIIGAGTVVVDDIPDNSVAVGVPARIIKPAPTWIEG